jgi:D-arginine dehydrogenase
MSTNEFDVVVIGGGIAGVSAAAELAAERRVLLLERESQPGYHTTGRSAALLTPFYGNDLVRALNLAGARWYQEPPPGFAETRLISPRGELYVGREQDRELVDAEVDRARAAGAPAERLDRATIRAMVPGLRPEWAAHGWYDASAADMDVATILLGFLRLFRGRGGQMRTDAEVRGLERRGGLWRVTLRDQTVSAAVVVNAAGAWADSVAALAGLAPLGITPLRRTVVILPPPAGHDIARWPGVADIAETWYVKPDAGKLLCSPADETPSEPCDAQPDELDVAICADRVQQALDIEIRRIEHRWAGLRCFAPDRTPVVGFDPRTEGFFWLAGQGGYGIMTAPVLAAVTRHHVAGGPVLGRLDLDALEPARLLATTAR